MDKSISIEEDGFILVNKEAILKSDDKGDVEDDDKSDRSSVCLVDDPAEDPGLFEGSEDEKELDEEKTATTGKDCASGKDAADSDGSETETLPHMESESPAENGKAKEIEAISSQDPKYVCQSCSVDIAATADIVWEGYMGANVPAFLFKKAKNLEASAEPRQQQLSTGVFLVQDMKCRNCNARFGWSYLKAWAQEQKYKEGTTIIQRASVRKVV